MTLPLPKLIPLGAGRWQLAEAFTYDGITVPAGMFTDGASSPFHILITQWGGHYAAAVLIHDYLYTQLNKNTPDPKAMTREAADAELYKVMSDYGVAPLVRYGIWAAVRLFGGNTWIKGLVITG